MKIRITTKLKPDGSVDPKHSCRLAFASLFEATTVGGEGEPAFSGSFLIPPDHPQRKEIEAAMESVATDKWGAKGKDILAGLKKSGKVCLKDGDEKSNYAGFPGNWFIPARNKTRPAVLAADRSPLVQADGKPYSGCYVNVIVEIWPQDNKYGKRINASLGGVQFVADGEAFAGGASVNADEFDDLAVEGGLA